MATPMRVQSPWSCFKRLKITSIPLSQPSLTASFVTSRRLLTENTIATDGSPAEDGQTQQPPPSPSKQSRKSHKAPPPLPDYEPEKGAADKPGQSQKIMRDYLFKMAEARGIPVPADLYPIRDHEARGSLGVEALYLAPLRRQPTHNIPVCNLQLRSYSVRNLETMADFALRAAYYLGLPAKGPVPLPRITERWTVPRSAFVHKKAQENWERVTTRRLVQIVDGHPDVVKLWLTFIRKWTWYGVGMRADVWENEELHEWKKMGSSEEEMKTAEETTRWELFGRRADLIGEDTIKEYMDSIGFAAGGTEPASTSTDNTVGAPTEAKGEKPKAKRKGKEAAQKA